MSRQNRLSFVKIKIEMKVNILFDDMSITSKPRKSKRGKSTRNRHYDDSMQRNQSSLMPSIKEDKYKNYYDEQGPLLNFVTASKRQMREAIENTHPKAQKFLDDGLVKGDHQLAEMPLFSSRQLRQNRPSAHSVNIDPARINQSVMLAALSDNCSEIEKAELNNFISPRSPRVLSNIPSKVSLATERREAPSVTSPSNSRIRLNSKLSNNSPTSGGRDALGRELKQLAKWLDSREIQIRTKLEQATNSDKILEHNGSLEGMLHNTMNQLRTKLPGSHGSPLEVMLQRIMQGLHECFMTEGKQYKRKLNMQAKEIKSLQKQKEDILKEFENFKANESVEAYFAKFQSITDRQDPTKGDKEIRDDLLSKVQDFIDNNQIDDKQIAESNKKLSMIKASDVETELKNLAMESAVLKAPTVEENLMANAAFETEKKKIFDDIFKELNSEAESVRRAVQKHQETIAGKGFKTPMVDKACGTLTFMDLENHIIVAHRQQHLDLVKKQAEQQNSAKATFMEDQINKLKAEKEKNKGIIIELQNKIRKLDPDTCMDDLKERISAFLRSKLGSSASHVIDDLDKAILELSEKSNVAKSVSLRSSISIVKKQNSITSNKSPRQSIQSKVTKSNALNSDMQSVAKSIVKSEMDSATDKNASGSVRQSQDINRQKSGRENFLDSLNNQEIVRKSHTSKVSDTSKPVDRGAIDMNVISDEDISDEVESKAEEKKNSDKESTSKPIAFDQTGQKSVNDQENKIPMQLGKQPFGVAAQRIEKEELLTQIKTIENISNTLQSFEGLTQVKANLDNIEELMIQLDSKIPIQIDFFERLATLKQNQDHQEIKERSSELRDWANSIRQSKQASDSKMLIQRLKSTSELEEIIQTTKYWISEHGQASNDIDQVGKGEFYKQLALVERAKTLVKELPQSSEFETVDQLTKSVSNLDKQIKDILESVIQDQGGQNKPSLEQDAETPKEEPAGFQLEPDDESENNQAKQNKNSNEENKKEITEQKNSGIKGKVEEAIFAVNQASSQIKSFVNIENMTNQESEERPSNSMLRVQKMLNNMDKVVNWMNQVKEHGGVDKAEAARKASGDASTPEATRRPALNQALQTQQSKKLLAGSPCGSSEGRVSKGLGNTHTQNMRQISDRDEQFKMEKTLTNGIGPQKWLEDEEANVHLHNQLEKESGLEKHLEKASGEKSQSRKRSTSRNTLHSVKQPHNQWEDGIKSPVSKRKTSISVNNKSKSQKSTKESKEKRSNESQTNLVLLQDDSQLNSRTQIEPVMEAPREAEESKLVIMSKRQSKDQQYQRINTPTIEEGIELHSSANSSEVREYTRTQVFKKTVNIEKASQNTRQSRKRSQRDIRGSYDQQSQTMRVNQDISDVVEKSKLNVSRNQNTRSSKKKSSESKKNSVSVGAKMPQPIKQRDGTIKFQNELEEHNERQKIQDMPWQFEQTFSHNAGDTGAFNSTTSKVIDIKANNVGVSTDMDPPTVYISKDRRDDRPGDDHSNENVGTHLTKTFNDVTSVHTSKEFLKRIQNSTERQERKVRVGDHKQSYIHEVIVNPDITDPANLVDSPEKMSIKQQTLTLNEDLRGTKRADESEFDINSPGRNHKRIAIERPQINLQTEPDDIQVSKVVKSEIDKIGQYQIKEKIPEGSVLMLPQATQTENKSLIKLLLGWINEAMMKHLEEQSINMSQEQFHEHLNAYKSVIPDVYNQVKGQSDTFFVEQTLGPNYNTMNVRVSTDSPEIRYEMNVTPSQDMRNAPRFGSNSDLQMIPQDIDESRATPRIDVSAYNMSRANSKQTLMIEGQDISQGRISPRTNIGPPTRTPGSRQVSPPTSHRGTHTQSQKQLNNVPSTRQLNNQSKLSNVSPSRAGQFLQLNDYSRYGSHTLELQKEIMERVTVKQLGRIGGGFIGSVEKTKPKY